MKKLTIILFAAAGIVILFFALKKYRFSVTEKDSTSSQLVVPSVHTHEQPVTQNESVGKKEPMLTSLVPLRPGEVLIAVLSIDFNEDNYDDQIIAAKDIGTGFVRVTVGLYNPLLEKYGRAAEIVTDIEQAQTFSLSVMDITGTHENALIISGYSMQGKSRLQAWLPYTKAGSFLLHEIADISADGTVFIQQKQRSDSYPLGDSADSSFPIWAYTSDPDAPEDSLDQLHIMYDWDDNQKKYVQTERKKITQKTADARELSKIQDGTEKTFAGFLDGLWIKAAETAEDDRYLFFDYEKKEIIFFQNDRQEIYSWGRSTLRHNGIFIYTTNRSMSNISRRFDITLVSTDEIRIKVVDNLGMFISTAPLWDGNYKNLGTDILFSALKTAQKKASDTITSVLQTPDGMFWGCDNGWTLSCRGNTYTAKNGASSESGVFSALNVFGETLLQFKSGRPGAVFSGFYRAEIIGTSKTENTTGAAGTRIILSPVKVNISQIEPTVSRSVQLELNGNSR